MTFENKNPRGKAPKKQREFEKPEFFERSVEVKRVANVVKGGATFCFPRDCGDR